MTTRATEPDTTTLRVVALAVACVGGVLVGLAEWASPTPTTFGLTFLALTLLVAAVQVFPVRLLVAGESAYLVISELPLVLGLFFLSPLELVVARLLGLVMFHAVQHPEQVIKAVVTHACYTLEAGVAVAIFWLWNGSAAAAAPTTGPLLAALVAVVAATTTGALVLGVAVSLSTSRLDLATVVEVQRVMLPVSLVNTSLSLLAMVVIHREPAASWLLVIPTVVVVLGYRRYLAERQDRQFLAAMYELARDVHQSRDVAGAFDVFARTLRDHIGATRLELYLQRAGGNRWGMVAHGDGAITDLHRVERLPPAAAASLSSAEPVLEHDARGRCTSVSYALDLGEDRHLAFVATDPASHVAGFQANAASVLTAVASHARAVLEDVELQEAKSSFLSSVSHELRTPLSVVLGAAETLNAQRDHLSEDLTRLLTSRMHAQATKLDGLLSNLLDVDRLGRGLLEPNLSAIDLGALVRSCVLTLDIETHQVDLRVEPVHAVVDAAACERIVENLVFNAAKYTRPGSTISVAVRAEDGLAVITVEDDGEGIADADKRRVFQPFVRLDPNHHSPGTGIGLSLVDRLVRMHGGDVTVDDAPTGGARFTVRLPLSRSGLAAAAAAADGPELLAHLEVAAG